MWRHIEPQRLNQAVQGLELLDPETEHLLCCAFCQELLILLKNLTNAAGAEETKAA